MHTIKYVAIDQDELSAQCLFNITVQSYFHAPPPPPSPRSTTTTVQHLAGRRHAAGVEQLAPPPHSIANAAASSLGPTEAYVMCPNRVAMKLDTTFPVSSFRVFYKNIYQPGEASAHVTSAVYPPPPVSDVHVDAASDPSSSPSRSRDDVDDSGDTTNASATGANGRQLQRVPRHFIDIYHWVV